MLPAVNPPQGVVVFLAGNLLQFWSHAALASLPSAAQPRVQGRHRRKAQPSSSSTAGTSAGSAAGGIPPGAALAAGIGAAAAAWVAAEPMWLSALGERDVVQLTTTEMLAVSAVVAVVAAVPVSLLLGLPLQNESDSQQKTSATNSSSGAGAGYVIPRGVVFALVSCPHYLGEVVLYLGLVLLTQGSINTLLMLAWVVSAAAVRWLSCHLLGQQAHTEHAVFSLAALSLSPGNTASYHCKSRGCRTTNHTVAVGCCQISASALIAVAGAEPGAGSGCDTALVFVHLS